MYVTILDLLFLYTIKLAEFTEQYIYKWTLLTLLNNLTNNKNCQYVLLNRDLCFI